MPFKKLHSDIREKLESLDILTPTTVSISSIPIIKSGANVYCVAPKRQWKNIYTCLDYLTKIKM